ncbi:ABC transporter G family member 14 [Araneus ventricosus]|uniref:ABC transporter G family member 14 n=1 Tax=Araneus ventricosus TaxID=182803 RepID=A0A4Y2HNF6_ARAVE|nr:ABC transporter G family member 14 [Araneus ventricosus]
MACYNAKESAVKIRVDGAFLEDLVPENQHIPLKLVFSGIYMSCKGKTILKDVCGRAEPGELLAIMGPSGSGKTSLLNSLSGRTPIDKGAITLNGKMLNKDLKRHIALAQQQDLFMPNLTLGYTLKFYSQMRLPSSMTDEQKTDFKNRIASLFNLDNPVLLKTNMGDVLKRGLSGGEMKRANIACEMFSMPSLLLVDEPTTGLDSHNALNVIRVLKDYAVNNHTTVVVTVHQPSSMMIQMFDKLLLMAEGKVAYFGNRADVIDKFAELGMIIEPHYNPADFIVDQLYDSEKLEKLTAAAQESRERELADKPSTVTMQTIMNGSRNGTHSVVKNSYHNSLTENNDKWAVSSFKQMRLLWKRSFTDALSRIMTTVNWIHAILLSCVVGSLWYRIPRTEENLSSIGGRMFFTSTIWLLTAVFETMTLFPSERAVINRERASGMYRLSAYYCAKMIGELPSVVIFPTVFHTISYLTFAPLNVTTFLCHWGILQLSILVSQSVGLFIGAVCQDVRKGPVICSLYSLPTILFGGYFVSSIPYWLSWLRYTSTVNFAFNAMEIVEYVYGNPIKCAAENSIYDACRVGNATFIPPSDIIKTREDPFLRLWIDILVLVFAFILFRVLGYLVLKFYKSPTRTI